MRGNLIVVMMSMVVTVTLIIMLMMVVSILMVMMMLKMMMIVKMILFLKMMMNNSCKSILLAFPWLRIQIYNLLIQLDVNNLCSIKTDWVIVLYKPNYYLIVNILWWIHLYGICLGNYLPSRLYFFTCIYSSFMVKELLKLYIFFCCQFFLEDFANGDNSKFFQQHFIPA